VSDYYDRFGTPMPDDWWDKEKHGKKYGKWQTDHRVGNTVIGDNQFTVSTVWLGLDHNYSKTGPPLIFETMVFGEPYSEELYRYSTEEEAMRGHLAVVDRLRAGLAPFDFAREASA
jgi:hypothetical protein